MGERRVAHRNFVGKPEEVNHLEDPGVDWRIILKWILEKLDGGVDSIAEDRNRWQALVNAVISLRVPQNVGNFLTS
jgi:hypothetical protein